SPWNEERIDKVFEKLYEGAKGKAEEFEELHKERATLDRPGPKGKRLKKLLKEVEEKLDKLWEWYKSFDRRVYLVHVQMAGAVNKEWKNELTDRYQFQMEVQRMYTESRDHQNKAAAYFHFPINLPQDQVQPD